MTGVYTALETFPLAMLVKIINTALVKKPGNRYQNVIWFQNVSVQGLWFPKLMQPSSFLLWSVSMMSGHLLDCICNLQFRPESSAFINQIERKGLMSLNLSIFL